MNVICDQSRLLFFKTEEYVFENSHSFDTSSCPRPHFCMGFVTSGSGVFHDCETGADVLVGVGDIIFVPMTSRYVSSWSSNGRISYVSVHFIFDDRSFFAEKKFRLQKVRLKDTENILADYEYMLKNSEDRSCSMGVLSRFYGILEKVIPCLECTDKGIDDQRIKRAMDFVRDNYSKDISVADLAKASNMSVSRFFPAFKKSTGITPVEYINNYRVSRAIVLLISDRNNDMSIEDISESVGFESSAYFRRVFKKFTMKNPRDYKKTSMEM